MHSTWAHFLEVYKYTRYYFQHTRKKSQDRTQNAPHLIRFGDGSHSWNRSISIAFSSDSRTETTRVQSDSWGSLNRVDMRVESDMAMVVLSRSATLIQNIKSCDLTLKLWLCRSRQSVGAGNVTKWGYITYFFCKNICDSWHVTSACASCIFRTHLCQGRRTYLWHQGQ